MTRDAFRLDGVSFARVIFIAAAICGVDEATWTVTSSADLAGTTTGDPTVGAEASKGALATGMGAAGEGLWDAEADDFAGRLPKREARRERGIAAISVVASVS